MAGLTRSLARLRHVCPPQPDRHTPLTRGVEGLAHPQSPHLRQHVVGVRQVRLRRRDAADAAEFALRHHEARRRRTSAASTATSSASRRWCCGYFSVYGPRQRPEMGYHLFIDAILQGKPIKLTGDGLQVRGNTYIADCVDATVRATQAMPGETFNLGGGELVTVLEVLPQAGTDHRQAGDHRAPSAAERRPTRHRRGRDQADAPHSAGSPPPASTRGWRNRSNGSGR